MKQVKDESVWPDREKSSKHESTTADTRDEHMTIGHTSQQGTTHRADHEGLGTTGPISHDRLRPDAVSPRRPGSSSAAGWPRHCLPSAPGELQCRRHHKPTSRFIRSCEKHRHKSTQLRAPQSHATQQHARRPPHWADDPSKRV